MKFVFALLSLYLIPGSAIALFSSLAAVAASRELWLPLLIGVVPGAVFGLFVLRWLPVISTFVHEFTHAMFALLFFRRIEKFVVTFRKGGYILHSQGFGGEFGNLMITVAPYFFPTVPVIAALLLPLYENQTRLYYLNFLGAALTCHVISAARDIRQNWSKTTFTDAGGAPALTDIGKTGYIAAVLSISGLTFFFLGLVLFIILYGYQGIWPLCKMVVTESWQAWNNVASLIIPMLLNLFKG